LDVAFWTVFYHLGVKSFGQAQDFGQKRFYFIFIKNRSQRTLKNLVKSS